MKYVVQVREILRRHFVVEANTADEAVWKAAAAHERGDISLEYGDYDGVEVYCIREADEEDVRRCEELEEDE